MVSPFLMIWQGTSDKPWIGFQTIWTTQYLRGYYPPANGAMSCIRRIHLHLTNHSACCKCSPYNEYMATKKRHKGPPAGETGQEALYLKSLSDRQVPVTIKLRDGEMVSGWVEYFDDMMLRLTREGKPNLFIYKAQIRTITEGGASGSRRSVINDEGAGL